MSQVRNFLSHHECDSLISTVEQTAARKSSATFGGSELAECAADAAAGSWKTLQTIAQLLRLVGTIRDIRANQTEARTADEVALLLLLLLPSCCVAQASNPRNRPKRASSGSQRWSRCTGHCSVCCWLLQVVHYSEGDYCGMHHDSTAGMRRYSVARPY